MARLLVVTGVLLAAAAARLGAPCGSVASCPCLVAASDDADPASRTIDALPATIPTVEPPLSAAVSRERAVPAAPPRPADLLAVAPKTSPPAPVA